MARGYGRRRGPALSPKLIMIIAGLVLVAIVGAVFWFAGQAESRKPEQTRIRVPATNVGPQARDTGGDAQCALAIARWSAVSHSPSPQRSSLPQSHNRSLRRPLGQVDSWGVGWLGANDTAIPVGFWANTNGDALGPIFASLQPKDLSPAARAALRRILLSRIKAPDWRRRARARTPASDRTAGRDCPLRRPAQTLCRHRLGQVWRTPQHRA